LLGVLYAALGAFTFALNNVTMRRGVVTGSVLQGMALTVPIGGLSFLVMTITFGELGQLVMFPTAAFTWLACQGIVHFVIGRYCNYKSNQLMGVNLTAPVVQLQVPFAMMLAVVMLREKFTVLQASGAAQDAPAPGVRAAIVGGCGRANPIAPACAGARLHRRLDRLLGRGRPPEFGQHTRVGCSGRVDWRRRDL